MPAGWSCLDLPAASWTYLNLWVWTLLGSHWANNLYYCGTDAISFLGERKRSSLHLFKTKTVLWLWQCCSSLNFTNCPRMCRPELKLCSCESGACSEVAASGLTHLTAWVCNWGWTAFLLYTTEFYMQLVFAVQQNVSLSFLFSRLNLDMYVCEVWGRLDVTFSDWNGSFKGSLRNQIERK